MDESIKTLPDLLDGQRVAMLTLASPTGLDARPLTIQRTDEHAVWFLVSPHTVWLPDLAGPANLAVADDKLWLSAAGTCELVDDTATVESLGDPISSVWFEEGEQPVALRFEAVRGEWWSAPVFARTALEVAKAKLTGSTPEVGEHGPIA